MEPVKTIETCFIGATNVLKLAKKLNIRVLQASTSEVYGDPLVHPIHKIFLINPVKQADEKKGKKLYFLTC